MHTTTLSAPAKSSGPLAPWMALFAVSTVPLFALQFSASVTVQIVAVLSLAMVAFAHITDDKNFDATHLAIKLVAPCQFALMIWLSVVIGREIGGASFIATYTASIFCLFGIVVVDALACAALALLAGSRRSVSGLSLATLINAKYAGLVGAVK